MNDIEKLINYIEDNSTNFLGSKATLKDLEEFNYMYDQLMEALEKLTEYQKLEEQGLLIKLPCKVGDTVYQNNYDRTMENYKVIGFEIDERGQLYVRVLIERPAATLKLSYRKEDLYFSREEAEKALDELSEVGE